MIRPHERFRARIERIGRTGVPVVVVDDFVSDPQALVTYAAGAEFNVRSRFYPGIRAPAPPAYQEAVRTLLRGVICQALQWDGDIEVTESNFSVVTTRPQCLEPFQRIPHFDGTRLDELAVLHYLCDARHGGTSFYRHRGTGYEIIDESRSNAYMHAVNMEVKRHGMPPARYINGDTPQFERIASYEAACNRALIYPGASLHSGNIPPDFVPDPDPRTGRLSVNSFVRLRPL